MIKTRYFGALKRPSNSNTYSYSIVYMYTYMYYVFLHSIPFLFIYFLFVVNSFHEWHATTFLGALKYLFHHTKNAHKTFQMKYIKSWKFHTLERWETFPSFLSLFCYIGILEYFVKCCWKFLFIYIMLFSYKNENKFMQLSLRVWLLKNLIILWHWFFSQKCYNFWSETMNNSISFVFFWPYFGSLNAQFFTFVIVMLMTKHFIVKQSKDYHSKASQWIDLLFKKSSICKLSSSPFI